MYGKIFAYFGIRSCSFAPQRKFTQQILISLYFTYSVCVHTIYIYWWVYLWVAIYFECTFCVMITKLIRELFRLHTLYITFLVSFVLFFLNRTMIYFISLMVIFGLNANKSAHFSSEISVCQMNVWEIAKRVPIQLSIKLKCKEKQKYKSRINGSHNDCLINTETLGQSWHQENITATPK